MPKRRRNQLILLQVALEPRFPKLLRIFLTLPLEEDRLLEKALVSILAQTVGIDNQLTLDLPLECNQLRRILRKPKNLMLKWPRSGLEATLPSLVRWTRKPKSQSRCQVLISLSLKNLTITISSDRTAKNTSTRSRN